jgi:hypothetical protein
VGQVVGRGWQQTQPPLPTRVAVAPTLEARSQVSWSVRVIIGSFARS